MGSNVLSWVEGRVEQAGNYSGHRRGVVHVPGEYFVIYDILESEQVLRSPRLHFQLAPGASVERPHAGVIAIRCGDASATLVYSEDRVHPSISEGEADSFRGWISDHYGDLRPSPSLVFDFKTGVDANALVLTAPGVTIANEMELTIIENGLVLRMTHTAGVDLLLINRSETGGALHADDIELDGRAAWVRTSPNKRTEVRLLDMSRFSNGRLEVISKSGQRVEATRVVYNNRAFETIVGDADSMRVRLAGSPAK